jgi:hypothetical protein
MTSGGASTAGLLLACLTLLGKTILFLLLVLVLVSPVLSLILVHLFLLLSGLHSVRAK